MKKRLFSLLLCVCMIIGLLPMTMTAQAAVQSGTDGTITWSIDTDTGVLTFSGSGEITSGGSWNQYRSSITSIVIEDGISGIGGGVFAGISTLLSVDIASSVTSIGSGAFSGSGLTSVVVPASVTTLGASVFSGCYQLASAEILASITSLEGSLFASCIALTEFAIAEGIVTVCNGVFANCTALRKVTIPSTVEELPVGAFAGCTALEEMIIAEENENFCIDEYGVMYNKNMTQVLFALASLDGEYTIPDGVEEIAAGAFSGIKKLTAITMPSSLVTIGNSAFSGCSELKNVVFGSEIASIGADAFAYTALTEIVIPDTVTMLGSRAFVNCSSLTSATIGSGIEAINDYTFQYCGALTTMNLGENVKTIGQCVFYNCTSLKSIELPAGLTTLGARTFENSGIESIAIPASLTSLVFNAFNFCKSLTAITVDPENPNYYSDKAGVLYTKDMKSLIACPACFSGAYEIPEGVLTVESAAFAYCIGLTDVTLPSTLTKLSNKAFDHCDGLVSVKLPEGITKIENDTFNICTNLKSVEIPTTVQAIGDYAFDECAALEKLVLPEGLLTIGRYTFEGCAALKSVTMPSTVTSIGNYAFNRCAQLEYVYYTGSEADWALIKIGNNNAPLLDANIYYDVTPTITYPVEGGNIYIDRATGTIIDADETITAAIIPETVEGVTVTAIGERAFYYCKSLASIDIPETVTSIGPYGFYYCSALTEIDIPDAVESIGTFAFNLCNSLTYLELPESLTVIEKDALSRMDKVEKIVLPEGVTSIGDHAFYACPKLTEINIPNTVETIEAWALAQTGIVEIEIPDSVTSFGDSMFYGCTKLESATLSENITSIPNFTFYGCDSMKEYVIADHITEIGTSAFAHCDSLVSVTIPDGVTTIGGGAFAYNACLKSINFPNSVKTVGDSVVTGCNTLETIEIGSGLESIGNSAFANNPALIAIEVDEENKSFCDVDGVLFNKEKTELLCFPGGKQGEYTVPDSVRSIGAFAFNGCAGLTCVKMEGNVTTLGMTTFANCSALTEIELSEGIETIPANTFAGCTSLLSITLPKSLQTVESGAFAGTWRLTDVYYGGTEAEWNEISITPDNTYLTGATIHYTEIIPDSNLKFNMNISAGAEMVVNYNFMAAVVSKYEDFYLEVSKNVAGGKPIVTTYGISAEHIAMGYMPHPATGEPLMYNASYTGINAKEMGDSFATTLYAIDASGKLYRGETVVRSIKDFLFEKLEDAASIPELKTMAVDMLKYGAAAQVNFGYDAENLVTADLSEEHLAWGTQNEAAAVDYAATSGSGANVNTNITVNSKVELGLSCIVPGQTNPAGVKCVITNAEGKVLAELTTVNIGGVMYSATYDNVGAKEMREVITATFYNDEGVAVSKSVRWSVESYVAQTRAKTGASANEIAVVNAMLVYGDSVAAYMTASAK